MVFVAIPLSAVFAGGLTMLGVLLLILLDEAMLGRDEDFSRGRVWAWAHNHAGSGQNSSRSCLLRDSPGVGGIYAPLPGKLAKAELGRGGVSSRG
jgi:hypothetical protein